MKSFLYEVAAEYYKNYGNTLHEFTFVFPNRRAGIFFQHHLSKVAQEPIFSPEITTINSCFIEASGLDKADRLSMLFKLFRIYKKITQSPENFDKFVFWGEIILADFNEVDKYRVNAEQLFNNLKELKELSDYEEIFSEEQKAAIEQFWINFYPTPGSKYREKFLQTWEVLFPLYENFKLELLKENIGYEGMITRRVVDELENSNKITWFDDKKFVFIGFNALNPCEKALMRILNKRQQADFYWDYGAETLRDKDNPASSFYRQNTDEFQSKFNIYHASKQNNKQEKKQVELYRISSSIGQAKLVYHLLNNLYTEEKKNKDYLKTAVVVPNESLMLPTIYSIPKQIKKINVTMGFPLKLTSIAGLMDHIFELHKRKKLVNGKMMFYHLNVRNIINHQFIALIYGDFVEKLNKKIITKNLIYLDEKLLSLDNLFEEIFNPNVNVETFSTYLIDVIKALVVSWNDLEKKPEDHQLESSFLYQYYIIINRIDDLLKKNQDVMPKEMDTLVRLIKQLTNSINIPFVGEPLDGLQIMGTLETRGLDFENIILTSFDEGVYPKHKFSNSFIPYNLRKGFSLPTFEHQDAITAYNFYQLFNRAKKIYFISDSRAEKINSGELSRFYHQLKYHYQYDIKETLVNYDIGIYPQEPIAISKSDDIQCKLQEFVCNNHKNRSIALSPSSINTYIQCPLRFYFQYVEKINTPDEISEILEANVFGSIFHEVMAKIYEPLRGQKVSNNLLTTILKNENKIEEYIQFAFAKHYFKFESSNVLPKLTGNNLLIANVIKKYTKGVLKFDMKYTPFTYLESEKNCYASLNTKYGDVKIKGFIDRIDKKDDVIRLIDYKTGRGDPKFKNWNSLFDYHQKPENQANSILQLLLYGLLYNDEAKNRQLMPSLIFTQKVFNDKFTYKIRHIDKKTDILNYSDVEDEFIPLLKSRIEDIFNPELPFFQTNEPESCKYCDFKVICKR